MNPNTVGDIVWECGIQGRIASIEQNSTNRLTNWEQGILRKIKIEPSWEYLIAEHLNNLRTTVARFHMLQWESRIAEVPQIKSNVLESKLSTSNLNEVLAEVVL